MFRALWIKHWSQLRTLRWVGFGLCVALPLFLWAGADAARRGWFPVGLGDFSLATLFGEALPALAMFLWLFLAVMFAAQTFAGDRAEGTERFLLERPVSRRKVWLARVLVALGSTLVVVLANTAYLFALARLVDDGSVGGLYSNLVTICSVGLGLSVLGTLGGMAAGEMTRTPMQAVLAGMILGAAPVAVAMFLASAFELVRLSGEFHLAYAVAPILPLALIFASYRAGCLGEPAGRGRITRGVVVLVVAFVVTPALFAAAAPFVLRATTGAGWPIGTARQADRAVIVAGKHGMPGGWVIETATGEKTRFLAPPVRGADWSVDGSTLAVIHSAGPLGSVGSPVLEWLDAEGRTLGSLALETEPSTYARGVHWAGNKMLVREWAGVSHGRIRVVDPDRGELGTIDVEGDGGQAWRLIGPIDDGSVYLHRLTGSDPRTYTLQRIDLEGMRLEEPVLAEDADLPTFALKFLSSSGRYWARVIFADKVYTSYVIDLETGERTDYPGSLIAGLMTGDRLVRLERAGEGTRVVLQQGTGEEILSREFSGRLGAKVSPDGERVLVTRGVFDDQLFSYPYFPSIRTDGLEELFVCDGREWTDLSSLVDEVNRAEAWVTWGGPGSLIASNGAGNAIAGIEPGSSWETVLGRWP